MATKNCPHCNKEYKNLKQHIAKSHRQFYIDFKQNEGENFKRMTVIDKSGNILAEDVESHYTINDVEYYEFWGDDEKLYEVELIKLISI